MPYPESSPLVGVIMGSDSDLPMMKPAALKLEEFGVAHETRVISAHRTPERMAEYGREAVERGLKVIIAGAGGSSHLQGMVASETRLPVLGVAIESSPDPLSSSFGSMLRMPEGIPLATMGKNNSAAANAALLAVRILALENGELAERYDAYVERLAAEVAEKDELLRTLGPVEYTHEMERRKAQ